MVSCILAAVSKMGFVINNGIFKSTVWKFHDFPITQILREINFGDSRSAKSAILTDLEALNLMFYEFFALFEG